MSLSLKQLEFCHSLAGEALLAAPLDDSDPLACVKQLRKVCAADMASAIMTVRKVRQKAARDGKFPADFAVRMLADDRMSQQSSSFAAAMYVGRKLVEQAKEQKNSQIYDLCCGMGANSIAACLAAKEVGLDASGGLEVLGFDISPEAQFCATHNAGYLSRFMGAAAVRAVFETRDVTELEIPADALVFIDPDRRADGRRSVLPSDCVPGDDFFRRLIDCNAGGAIKLSPACSANIFDDWPVSWQYVSSGGRNRQLLLWWPADKFASGAVVLHGKTDQGGVSDADGYSFVPACAASICPHGPVGKYILVPDAAILAAGAVDALAEKLSDEFGVQNLSRIAPGAMWLSCDTAPPADCHLVKSYEILCQSKPREADIIKQLAQFDAAQVEVKTFGTRLNTDELGKKLSAKGNARLTVLWHGQPKSQVYIAKRCD